MGVDFGVIWAADFNNVIRFYVHRTSRRPRVTHRPPLNQNSKEMTDIWLLRVILFHEFWKSPLQLVNTTVFFNSKQHLLKPIFSKMKIDRRKRLFVAERTTSKSDFFIFQNRSI